MSETTPPTIVALNEAIALFPTVLAFSEAIGVSESAPYMWRQRRNVPAEYCPAILRETAALGSPISCERLRPDIPWQVVRDQTAPADA